MKVKEKLINAHRTKRLARLLGLPLTWNTGTHLEVGLIEVVEHIPANLAVLTALLHHGVEEGQHIHQAAEGGVGAGRERLLGDLEVRGSHVEFQPVGRLRHHLR